MAGRIIGISTLYVSLLAIGAGVMYLLSNNEQHSEDYVAVVGIILSWPVLAFALVITVIVLFSDELRHSLSGLYLKSLGSAGAEFAPRVQPRAPKGDRPIRDVGDSPGYQLVENAERNTEELRARLREFQESANQWQDEAQRWWHRYLVAFLTPRSLSYMLALEKVSPINKDQFLSLTRWRIAQSLLRYLDVQSLSRYDSQHALEALLHYALVTVEDDQVIVTDKGRAFLSFLNSDEGQRFIAQLHGRELFPDAER